MFTLIFAEKNASTEAPAWYLPSPNAQDAIFAHFKNSL